MPTLAAGAAECTRLEEEVPTRLLNITINHKQIHDEAVRAAALLREARLSHSEEKEWLREYGARISRTGFPQPHIKNIGKWFYRVFLRDARQQADLAAHKYKLIGKNGSEIVSNEVFQSRQRQLLSQKKYISQQEILHRSEDGQELCIPFDEICNSPERRFAKHYVRVRGLEAYCRRLGLPCLFLTFTLPACYHPNPSKGRNSWTGLTPKQGHDEMQKKWRIFQRRFGKLMGVRVEEQHTDGCIHWHMLVWVAENKLQDFVAKIEKYFGRAPATKIVAIDSEKGSAASYVMKYILEATGAKHPETDEDICTTSARADAHRSTWGGKAITFFDVKGSATIWDQIRRIKIDSEQYLQLSSEAIDLHRSAVLNNYGDFLAILQSMNDASETACKPLYLQTNEHTRSIKGLIVKKIEINTHNKNWILRKKKL